MRAKLAEVHVKKSGAAFYQIMAKLEKNGLVHGWYVEKKLEDYAIRERHYQLTEGGADEWRRAYDFYLSFAPQRRVVSTPAAARVATAVISDSEVREDLDESASLADVGAI